MKKTSKVLVPTLALGMAFGASGLSASAATETIESGDTLWGIAQENDVSVEELMKYNSHLDPHALPIGTEVELDSNHSNTNSGHNGDMVTHTVQPGNTLYEIAQTYDGVSVNDLYDLNEGIDPYNLMIGSEVNVMMDEHSNSDNNSNDSDNENNVEYHTVQPGNTFYGIASVYDGVTVDEIMEANPNVDPTELTIGSQITIPLD
ncbi:LysM peptidoglycan-binding domain-containing protein [Metabacillus litoralis]|uniref:lytic transglycosylase n=1 Tax=Metabacillus litoralis TaxID=152268 RepID=UPI001CFCAF04|nr:LysM domain-containing protein [Metabacillus litoralis]